MATATYRAMVARDDVDFELRDIDERILDILEEGRCTRKHLADLLDVSSEYVYQRVDLMAKLGLIEIIHDGFYQLANDVEEADGEAGPKSIGGNDESHARVNVQDGQSNLRDRAKAAIDEMQLHGQVDDYDEARKDALLYAWDYLREHGSSTSREIATAVADEHGYDAMHYSPWTKDRYPAYSLWKGFLSESLRELPGVDAHTENDPDGEWAFVNEEE